MNILLIPSWYPDGDYFMNGIFIKEQALAFARTFPEHKIGVSLWGQQKDEYLLWTKDQLNNVTKVKNGLSNVRKTRLVSTPLPN
ncbi:hypothetical protein [Lunatimonas salinarum]|uniref:hypothetical protein n=1 Tax=Lunatimonas salinarum TaxID=1774590 RepID=UPI001ADF9D19|nr:hypothetical protein [Lunatimonas salinarum]